MHYITLFDASAQAFRNWGFVAFGLIFVAIGAVLVFAPGLIAVIMRRRVGPVFGWFFFLFAIVWTTGAGISVLGGDNAASGHAKRRECATVEGKVENFHPMPAEGHDLESFDVAGQHFEYSDFIVSAGFNNTASHGGPIREGLRVRICEREGEILILEVAR